MIFIYLFNLILDLLSKVFWLATGCLVRGWERSGRDRLWRGRGMGHYRGAEGEHGLHVTRDDCLPHLGTRSSIPSCCHWWWSCCCCHCSGSFYVDNVVQSESSESPGPEPANTSSGKHKGGSMFTVYLEIGFESLWIFRVYIGVAECCRVEN